jgi:hypothetical protein
VDATWHLPPVFISGVVRQEALIHGDTGAVRVSAAAVRRYHFGIEGNFKDARLKKQAAATNSAATAKEAARGQH